MRHVPEQLDQQLRATDNDEAGQETKAQQPLREARIDVIDVPGKPGCYKAVAFLARTSSSTS